jgi:hypothetical protein
MIGPISFEAKQAGERNARNWHVAFDAAGAGNVAWSRCCDTRRRKSELTGNTNFDLNRRASLRPYLRGAEGEIPSAYSPRKKALRGASLASLGTSWVASDIPRILIQLVGG